MSLHDLLKASARTHGARTAIAEGGGAASIDYSTLDRLSDRLRDRLGAMGIGRGDRVGIYLRKSIDSVASIFGILKAGAAYVPVDPTAPASRNAYIHNNCGVSAVIVDRRFEGAYLDEIGKLGRVPPVILLDETGGGGLDAALCALDANGPAAPRDSAESAADDLAYILYTSGSTGRPKGVMLSHHNAVSFVDWCAETFDPRPTDVFSSHAPFHFDLSILDIYVPLKHGAALVLIPEEAGKDPLALSGMIARAGGAPVARAGHEAQGPPGEAALPPGARTRGDVSRNISRERVRCRSW